jgi:hypothetical protein
MSELVLYVLLFIIIIFMSQTQEIQRQLSLVSSNKIYLVRNLIENLIQAPENRD